MKKTRVLLLAIALALPPSVVYAAKFTGLYFQHHDWELACDNTGTCRAAGYQQDRYSDTISVLLTRLAGPNQPVAATLMIGRLGDPGCADQLPDTFEVSMSIDEREHGSLLLRRDGLSSDLNDEQLVALLAALRSNSTIEWTTCGPPTAHDWSPAPATATHRA